MKTFKKELPCQLTLDELDTRRDELARLTLRQLELEDEKKQISSDFKAKIDKTVADKNLLARKIATKREQRPVDVYWDYDWNLGKKYLIRTDTMEVVQEEKITEAERQQEMDLRKQQ